MTLDLHLREVEPEDLDVLFEQGRDPDAVAMAAFTAADPDDRQAFDARWERILGDEPVSVRAIVLDGRLAGSVLTWRDPTLPGPEVSYWIGREFWGRGVATAALTEFLSTVDPRRPMYGRAAADNVGSIRVLEKCGFVRVAADRGFANARGEEIEEVILRLD